MFFSFFFAALALTMILLGLHCMTTGLAGLSGPRLRHVLAVATRHRVSAFFLGLCLTALLQSSSVVNVTVVGLVNAGLLPLGGAMAIVLGANVGTTVTAQMISFDLSEMAPFIAATGFIWSLLAKRPRWKSLSRSLLGMGAIFVGLDLLGEQLGRLSALPSVQHALLLGAGSWGGGILAGTLFTAIVQSSSAMTALTIALARQSLIPLKGAVALTLGANVGTVMTTIVVSLMTRAREGRQIALFDLLFNVAGLVVLLPFAPVFLDFVAWTSQDPARQVANAHTFFNLLTALLTLPLLDGMVWLVRRLLPK